MVKKKVEELTIEENWNNALIPVDKQPYEIPQNWCWVRLDSIVSIVTGKKMQIMLMIMVLILFLLVQ